MKRHYFGIVEGFFSNPLPVWSNEERMRTLRFLAAYCPGVNAYLYCPKDDPYVNKKWEAPYPKSQLLSLRNAASFCKKQAIRFRYGLNPAFSVDAIQNGFEGYVGKIVRKLEQLQGVGIKDFCILYDDIPYAYYALSGLVAKDARRVGELQARILNRLNGYLSARGGSVWLCPSDYFFVAPTPYTRALKSNLDARIPLIWTGSGVFAKSVTRGTLHRAQRTIGLNRTLIWWDNYPVNDCEHIEGTFHVGAFSGPSLGVLKNLGGVLMNPMREADANYIAYLTFSDYLANPSDHSREASLESAFRKLFGAHHAAWLRVYASFSSKNVVDDAPRGYLREMLAAQSGAKLLEIIQKIQEDVRTCKRDMLASECARLFARRTLPVIRNATRVVHLVRVLLHKADARPPIERFDVFPVVLRKNYFTKIVKVARARIAFTQSLLPTGRSDGRLNGLMRKLAALERRYACKSKLEMSAGDERSMTRLIRRICVEDGALFARAIKTLFPLEAIKLAIRRSLINGY